MTTEIRVDGVRESTPADQPPPVEAVPPKPRILREPATLTLISTTVLLVIWQLLGRRAGSLFLPTPIETVRALIDLLRSGELNSHIATSVRVFMIGFVAAGVLGVALGVAGGYFRTLGGLLQTPFTIFWSTPTVALIPVMVLWIGLNMWTQVTIVFLATLWPVAINTMAGVRDIDRTLLDVAAVFGKSRATTFRRVVIPAAAPHIASGLRLGVGRAVIGVFVAELFTGTEGLGARMSYYAAFFETDNYFAALIIFVIFSVLVTRAVVGLTSRWVRWRADEADR